MEVLLGIFYKTSYGCMCQSYCFFWLFCFFALLLKKHYKIGFVDDFEMLIFSFFGQKSRVNNLAMVGSITWPSFWPKFCPERWPSYWPYSFHAFLLKLVFFQKIHSPCRKKRIFEKTKKNTTKKYKKKKKKQMAKLLTFDGQVIDPTAYIYIYMCCGVTIWSKFGLLRGYYLVQVCFVFNTFCQKHYENWGFSPFLKNKSCVHKFRGYYLV